MSAEMWAVIVAATSTVIAVIAVVVAHKANIQAKEANAIAVRAEQRAIELHEVEWDIEDVGSKIIFTNRGISNARDVHYRVIFGEGQPEQVHVGEIPLGWSFELLVPGYGIGRDPGVRVTVTWKSEAGTSHSWKYVKPTMQLF